MTDVLYLVYKNIKRWRKIPNQWKIASVTPNYKKGKKRLVTIWRPVSLMNTKSKIFEKGM